MEKFVKTLVENTTELEMFYTYANDPVTKIGMRKTGKDIIVDGCCVMISGTPFTKKNEKIKSTKEMNEVLQKSEVLVNVVGQCLVFGKIVSIQLGNYVVFEYSESDKTVKLKRK